MNEVSCPSKDLPDLIFHRFPLGARLHITMGNRAGRRSACVSIELFDADISILTDEFPEDQLINGNDWFPLVADDLVQIRGCMNIALVKSLGPILLRQYLNLMKLQSPYILLDEENSPSFESEDEAPELNEIVRVPDEFVGTLFPYQKIGVSWLYSIGEEDLGCVLADDMGLGKTVQVIVFLLMARERSADSSLIIAPTTLLENWRRELERFSPSLHVVVHRGFGRTGFPSTLSSYDVVLTSYDTGVRDLSLLKMIDWNVVVLDEAQAIKNPDTQRSVAIKEINKRVGLAVTGTPIENRLSDLWSIMDFACPGVLGNQGEFKGRYVDSVEGASALEPIVSPLILRRLVSEVARDLPSRINIPQAVSLSDASARVYEGIRSEIVEEYGASANLVVLTKLRMYCTHPFLVTGDQGDPALYSSKYERLLEILREIFSVDQKVIVFTSYTKMVDIICNDLPRRFHLHCDKIDGRTQVEERQGVVDYFQKVAGSAALILNPRAAGTGLNITAANHVIHYNLEWNPAIEDQASARAYRRGQKRPVTVHRLFHNDTVEEVINERVAYKRELVKAAIVGTSGERGDLNDITKALQLSPLLNKDG